ncbi:hypothetical protein [Agrobacterium radiobacter]|uniref:hypothetical protein n=1 Tax=Agrobacterium radiobacter TaxID=362 RepID=UPI00160660E1|nr:hypothetical protein [Agrobacterium radiobacter]MBB4408729.1 hypothetical protein [Agrobacterium radiobacter]MBB4454424.1 hypothetical protein [Agrobacterium radiobacter]
MVAKTYSMLRLNKPMIDYAYEEAKKLPRYNYSHREFQANFVGCLGEISLARFFQLKNVQFIDQRANTTHDFLMAGKLTLDVKTKERSVRPKSHYENSVPKYNHSHQRPDFFYFVSLLRNTKFAEEEKYRFTHACIVGAISLSDLESKGIERKEGTEDPSNGTIFWTDCLNVTMEQISENREMLRLFGGVNDDVSPIRSVA